MRVICIDGVSINDKRTNSLGYTAQANVQDLIFEGQVYTIVSICKFNGIEYYQLRERRFYARYNSRRFVPLSDLDETIIHADKIKEDSYV
jgi:hypothetical protein